MQQNLEKFMLLSLQWKIYMKKFTFEIYNRKFTFENLQEEIYTCYL